MKEKILYSSAIVSDELYVERDADRKLSEVIQRMSKPAYISVARQMGKTNLLIHAKRTLEDVNNRYVYIDVTNDFNTSQDCFRYIINQILNSNEEIEEFQLAKEKIVNSRKESKINASEEYQNEIREILKHYKGNLIIFLDEVDDLRKHSFSDDIFGQIRKTYFIRETYSALKRVAYILSGVIDPDKLIKTKENSPFNIAIPIYLEDFNKSEFYELVHKSGLDLERTVKEYIFEWLSGNPRMSFEILSLIEDEYIKGRKVTNELVDQIINEFYLTTFKNPPIDHIRDVVSNNTDIRKGLVKLKKGLIDELSDDIINKFYLLGITASKINKHSLVIKNKVFKTSLSDAWLEKIELEKRGYYEFGIEKLKGRKYEEAIKLLDEYIQNEPKGNLVASAKFNVGRAYYELSDARMSNEYLLEKPMQLEKSAEYYYWQLFYLGSNFLKLGNFETAIIYFDDIIKNCILAQVVINSYISKGESLINLNKPQDIYDTYSSALDYLDDNLDIIEEINFYKTMIYYRLGMVNHNLNNKVVALEYFELAKKTSSFEEKVIILLYIDSCLTENTEKRIALYKELYELIIVNHLGFTVNKNAAMPFVESHLNIILTNLYDFQLFEEFDRLVDYSLSNIYNNAIEKYELFYKVSLFAVKSDDINVCEALMLKILDSQNVSLEIQMVSNQFLGLIADYRKDKNAFYYLSNYLKCFIERKKTHYEINENDFHAFIALSDHYRVEENYYKSYEVASILEKNFSEAMSVNNKALSVTVLFFIMEFHSLIKNNQIAKNYGDKILNIVDGLKPKFNELREIDLNGVKYFEKETKLFLLKLSGVEVKSNKTVVFDKEPGRNDIVNVKYNDGKLVKTKYKKIIMDLKNGLCELM